ncbi:MAG TPA: hypothetical protein VFU89_05940 [Rhabdochlamydiaceae bacterium]|nr:hypothetical protein [Rhabdochlamydiaceae bacterium]
MSVDSTLKKFNATAFEPFQRELVALEKEIDAYEAQKKKTNTLAVIFFATFVLFFLKLVCDKLTGIDFTVAASSSSSVIVALFDLALGGITLMYILDANRKTHRFAQRIGNLVLSTTRKFYGEITEPCTDPSTSPDVLESMLSNLKPHIQKTTPLIKDYILIATHEFILEGDSVENFRYSSKKITDNFKEVEATIGQWRKYYSEQYDAKPESRNSALIQVYASQCIQGLPILTIVDGQSSYTCHSPSALNPKSGHYIHTCQNNKTENVTVVPLKESPHQNSRTIMSYVLPTSNIKAKKTVDASQDISPTARILLPMGTINWEYKTQ